MQSSAIRFTFVCVLAAVLSTVNCDNEPQTGFLPPPMYRGRLVQWDQYGGIGYIQVSGNGQYEVGQYIAFIVQPNILPADYRLRLGQQKVTFNAIKKPEDIFFKAINIRLEFDLIPYSERNSLPAPPG